MERGGEEEELSVGMSEVHKRAEGRVARCQDAERGVGGREVAELESRVRGFSGDVERMYPNIAHLV